MRLGALALLLAVHAAVVIGAVALLLTAFGDTLDRELDREVERIERRFERDVEDLRREVLRDFRQELDRRAGVPAP